MRCAERTLDVLSIPSFLRKSDQNCLEKEKKKSTQTLYKVHICGEKSCPGFFCGERRQQCWEEEEADGAGLRS